jgi:hypothetical protein
MLPGRFMLVAKLLGGSSRCPWTELPVDDRRLIEPKCGLLGPPRRDAEA